MIQFCKSSSSTCSKTSTLTKSSSTTDEPSLITEMMAVDQTRFDSEYIQYLGNSYERLSFDAEPFDLE